MRLILAIITTTLFCNVSAAQWTRQQSGTTARLRGLAVVNAKVVWASGAQGTYVRTTDGGITWKSATVPGASDLDFRDADMTGTASIQVNGILGEPLQPPSTETNWITLSTKIEIGRAHV